MTWEIIKETFLDQFFPREMRVEKMVEFINLCHGGRTDHEYSFEFIKFSKNAPPLVSDPRDQMSYFVTSVSEDLKEEYHSAILHDNMKISHIMVYKRRVEEATTKRKSRAAKKQRCRKKHYGDCLKGMDNCFICGKSGHKMRDCPNLKIPDKGSGQSQESCFSGEQ